MKSFTTLFMLFCLFLTATGFAQVNTGKLSGIVKNAEGATLNGATVSLLKAKDSSLAKAAVSDKTGAFEIEKIAFGKYLIRVSAVGFSSHITNAIELTDEKSAVNMPAIQLNAERRDLGNVQVTVRRPLIEHAIDKTIVNVEAAVTNVGSTALEVLEKSPGISVDRDGNISLKGKQGVIVLVDGKPTYLSATDLANLLRNMPANNLDQIEIMSQPSARFDASGNSGVINIKTKRQNTVGFNGSFSLGYTQGVYPKSNNSFAINSRKGKLNLFANYSYSYFSGFNNNDIIRKFTDQSSKIVTGIIDQKSTNLFISRPHALKLGADLFASKKTTLGVVVNGFYNARNGDVYSIASLINADNKITSYNQAKTSNKDSWGNYSVNLNLRHVFDSTGKELTADIDHVSYVSKSRQVSDNDSLNTAFVSGANPYLLRGNLPSDIRIYTAKVDYSQPLSKTSKFEAGVKTSYVETDNDAQYTSWDKTTSAWIIDERSNHFIYSENINAAYINFNRQMKKWGAQLGLRLENTIAKGKQIKNNQAFNRNYTQLFPTSFISYKLNKTNNFGLSYGRRIERPNYQDMNPFQYFLDRYTYREGNPNLTPQFSHNIELSHNYKGQLNSSVNYTRTTDIINDVLIQNDTTRVTFLTKRNIATRRNIGLSLSYNRPVTKYYTVSFSSNIFNNYFEGYLNNVYLQTQFTGLIANISNQFKFNKGWSGEVSGFYRSKTLETGLMVASPLGALSLGASKLILKSKGTVRLNVRDILYTQKFHGVTKFDNIDADIRGRGDSRQVSVAFTYRFGKNQNVVPQPRKRTNAAQDEQNRAGQSN